MGIVSEKEIIKMQKYFNAEIKKHKTVEYSITEQFTKNNTRTYNALNIRVQIDDGEVMFSDANEVIWNNELSVLRHFLADSCQINFRNRQIELVFDCGSVNIEVLSVLK